jgi:hypothetical protein
VPVRARRRGNGEGTIYFVPSKGLYRAAVTMPDGTRKYVGGKTRKAAAEKLTKLQHEVQERLPTASGDRLGPFLQQWLESLEAKATAEARSVNTVDNARWAVETWIEPTLGAKRMRDLEPEHVEALLAKMAKAGRSRRTVGRVKSYLGQALDFALRRGKVSRNVARIAEMPATKPPDEGSRLACRS